MAEEDLMGGILTLLVVLYLVGIGVESLDAGARIFACALQRVGTLHSPARCRQVFLGWPLPARGRVAASFGAIGRRVFDRRKNAEKD
jgi:hypothetical protein